ncbi:hypothetical protein [Streptomyces orinoci]|uniref:Phosphodiesterase n=1 Tax=Streptomyces orinoci TaxID=67339 RepID=A0ABV3K4P2_STRON|nr:hypothetical protein [Streptomyces orinoci]
MTRPRLRFDGWIAGVGTASGTRLVLGHWPRSPFGPFGDVMMEHPDGTRRLLAPTERVADFVAATYRFDDVDIKPVTVERVGAHWTVTAGPLLWRFTTGPRTALGRLLRWVPSAFAARPLWIRCADLPARAVGLRTLGDSPSGHRSFYGARDLHRITGGEARWQATDLGPLAGVEPPVRFGSVSVPPRPSLVRITTIVELPDTRPGA